MTTQIVVECKLASGYVLRDMKQQLLNYGWQYKFTQEDLDNSNDLKMGLKNGWLLMISIMRNVPRKLNLIPHRRMPVHVVQPGPITSAGTTPMTQEQISALKQELAAEIRNELKNELKSMMPELAASLNAGLTVKIAQATHTAEVPKFLKPDEPVFIPTISTDDMTHSVKVATVSSESVDDISAMLKKTKALNKK